MQPIATMLDEIEQIGRRLLPKEVLAAESALERCRMAPIQRVETYQKGYHCLFCLFQG